MTVKKEATMDSFNPIDRSLHLEVGRKQAQLWAALFDALTEGWRGSRRRGWRVEPDISFEEVMQDLSYGRD